MKGFLQHRSHRFGYDGWGLVVPGSPKPLLWTVSTTREEVCELCKERPDLFAKGAEPVKVRITVEVVPDPATAP